MTVRLQEDPGKNSAVLRGVKTRQLNSLQDGVDMGTKQSEEEMVHDDQIEAADSVHSVAVRHDSLELRVITYNACSLLSSGRLALTWEFYAPSVAAVTGDPA